MIRHATTLRRSGLPPLACRLIPPVFQSGHRVVVDRLLMSIEIVLLMTRWGSARAIRPHLRADADLARFLATSSRYWLDGVVLGFEGGSDWLFLSAKKRGSAR